LEVAKVVALREMSVCGVGGGIGGGVSGEEVGWEEASGAT
jgi:hypothetical protein